MNKNIVLISTLLFVSSFLLSLNSCESYSKSGIEKIARERQYKSKTPDKITEQPKESTTVNVPQQPKYIPPVEAPVKGASLSEMYDYLKQGVFMVFATNDGETGSLGSGFFVESSGIGITNYHVLDGYDYYSIKTLDGNVYEIDKIIKSSHSDEYDYVMFTINNQGSSFRALPIANDTSSIGKEVFAIGSPKGLEATLTKGIVSQYRENGTIQHDAEIDKGSSGGPLFNMSGEVIGINSSGHDGKTINFAIDIRKLNLSKRPSSHNNQIEKGSTIVSYVQRVVDGDTFVLTSGEKVRLIGIDTPETVHPRKPVEPFGPEASQFTKRLLEGKEIELEFDVDRYDRYNRLLAYVYVEGVFLNEELVKQGLAVMSTYPPNVKYVKKYEDAQQFAKTNNLGIWSLYG